MYTKLKLNPSGYWIDMNENSNFIPGERSDTGINNIYCLEECPPANPITPPLVKPEIDDSIYIPFSVSGE